MGQNFKSAEKQLFPWPLIESLEEGVSADRS